ncbi:MAG: CBS and ACT domain-containing protein [Anaerolineae bacterium]
MLVYERMTHDPITIGPNTPVADALQLIREKSIHRLPVLDKKERLIGIVTEKELLYASPSPVTSLSIHEITYLLSKLTVDEVMTRNPITVTEDTPIEDAAALMMDHDIGALPVMRGQQLIGIVTETDLFETFIELFSAREKGVRLTLLVPEVKGELYTITHAISEMGGNILSLGTFQGEDPTNRLLTVKVAGVDKAALIDKMQAAGAEVVDARTSE